MRSLTLTLLLLGLLAPARGSDLTIARVGAEWRAASAFDRISEYFGGSENTGGHTILRTHADARAGFYFLVPLEHAALPTGAKLELQVIRPDSPETKTFSFAAGTPTSKANRTFELGLTGADWPGGAKARPAAWRLAVLDADGHVLAEQKSFLWENPPK
jgi:hypothetical protein